MMKNSKFRRILLLLACAVLLVSLSVGATLAYLTSTDEVENTFTVGDVKIKLDEAKVDENGHVVNPDDRTEEGNKLVRMVPGRLIAKDPTVTVEKGSEDCYVRVKVIVTVPGWEAAKDDTNTEGDSDTGEGSGTAGEPTGESFEEWAQSFETDYILYDNSGKSLPGFNVTNWAVQMNGTSNKTIDADNHTITYILTYKVGSDNIVVKETTDHPLEPIFTHIYVPTTLGNADLAKLAGMSINVVAEAIQAEGFTASGDMTAEMKAWEAFDNPN